MNSASYLFAGPDLSSAVVYPVPAGATVEVMGCRQDWCHIKYATQIGFVPVYVLDPYPNREALLPGEYD